MFKGFRCSPGPLVAALFLIAVTNAPRATAQQVETQATDGADVSSSGSPSSEGDKYIWLEDVSSSRSMAWVNAENARSLKVLETDPHYAAYHADALKLSEAPDRLPLPDQRGDEIYNFWRDANHVNGILRKTTLADYITPQPSWKTVIDYDALGKQDNVKWVSEGVDCLYPGDHYCTVALSAGGEDAQTLREFDLKSGRFVDGGFTLSHSKQQVSWLDSGSAGPHWTRRRKSSAARTPTSAPAATPHTTAGVTRSPSSFVESLSLKTRLSSLPPTVQSSS
jgi:prolyl oligopeptidase PreP (S9A serine peptidase family)